MSRVMAAVVLALGLSLLAAPDAAAVPRNCWSNGAGYQYAKGQCTSGTGSFQVWANCKQYVWPFMYYHEVGNWVRVGQWVGAQRAWSELRCPFLTRTDFTGVSIRN